MEDMCAGLEEGEREEEEDEEEEEEEEEGEERVRDSSIKLEVSERDCWKLAFSSFMTELATWSLNFCSERMSSSTVPAMIILNTLTDRRWPKRCARSIACRSTIGFQSCSKRITVSAPVKLSPRPPTLVVDSRQSTDTSPLKWLTTRKRSSAGMATPMRRDEVLGVLALNS